MELGYLRHSDKSLGIFSNQILRYIEVKCNVQGSVHCKYPFDIFPTRCNITHFIYFWNTALHVSGGISTHHQEHTQLYLQCLVLVNRYCYCGRVGAGP